MQNLHAPKFVCDLLLATAMTDVAVIARVSRARGHYEVLGVERDATADDVKRAFRALSLKVHPDRNKQSGAEAAFKLVNQANAVLSDAQERAAYSRELDGKKAGGGKERNTKKAKEPAKSASELAEEAELEKQLDAELEALRRQEWVANARYEQGFAIKACGSIVLFVAFVVVVSVVMMALPESGQAAGDAGSLSSSLAWVGSFIGRLVLGVLGLAALIAATPFMLWAFIAGMGKLCGWFFDLCELLFQRVLTPLLEHVLSGPRKSGQTTGPAPRPARRRK